jgi:light-regulated signal transduction histidine kinase (bacteriophytochrome)
VLRQLLDQQDGARAEGLVIDRYGQRHAVTVTLEPLGRDTTAELMLVIVDHLRPALDALRHERLRDRAQDEAREKRAIETEMATRELEAFSQTVSHDLRHPVNLIDGFARILQEDYAHLLDQAGRDHVMRILNASHRMSAMIDALLETHRISSQAVVPDPVDLSSLATGIADELRDRDPAIRSKIEIEPGMACRGDRVLLRMLVWNLFENAWKYSARSRCREIHFDTVRVHDSQVFRIRDNGIGFDMRFADQIFGLFHRLHGSTEFAGSGVGLATVQRIVRRHRGRIWVESEPGKGSTFFFTLWDD